MNIISRTVTLRLKGQIENFLTFDGEALDREEYSFVGDNSFGCGDYCGMYGGNGVGDGCAVNVVARTFWRDNLK